MLPPDSARSNTLYLTPATPVRLVSRKVRVEIVGGPDAGKQAELPGPEVRIGSAPGCDLVLRDPTVSRVHLTLRVDGDRIRIIDAGSTNGTTVDGLLIRDAFARPDSRIQAGNTSLRLAMLPDVVEIPISVRDRFGSLFGRSEAMRRVFAVLERVAPTDTTILVEGETGTGKELVAEGLHEESQRCAGPFVVFDCSAVSPSLIESELFGHVKGAYTGAFADRAGAFEAADGGTLFLDEVGELPLDLQPKLLRALERREVRRIGSNQVRRVDVRIIAATNRSLNREVERGRFREDLYYRLAVINVGLPPLRERPEDIPLLIQHFTVELGGAKAQPLTEALVKSISNSTFPGNVRELRNLVARALSLRPPLPATASSAPPVSPTSSQATVAFAVDLNVPLKIARDRVIDQFEQAYLREALSLTSGNVTRAADLAGVNRKFIQRAMGRLGLRDPDAVGDDGPDQSPDDDSAPIAAIRDTSPGHKHGNQAVSQDETRQGISKEISDESSEVPL